MLDEKIFTTMAKMFLMIITKHIECLKERVSKVAVAQGLNDSILFGQAGFESRDGLGLFLAQNYCQLILVGRRAFSNNVFKKSACSSFFCPVYYHHLTW